MECFAFPSDGIHILRLALLDQLTLESTDIRTTEDIVGCQDPNGFLEPDAVSEPDLSVLIDGGNRQECPPQAR